MQEAHNCSPSTARDFLIAHAAVRLGRLNRVPMVRRMRRLVLDLLARPNDTVRTRMSYGFDLHLPVGDTSLMEAILNGILFETGVATALRSVLREGDIFVDGGSHIGLFAILAAATVGKTGHVVAFEPHPLNAILLRFNVDHSGLWSRIIVVEAALGPVTGTGNYSWSSSSTTLGRLALQSTIEGNITQVKTIALDDYLLERKEWANVIKLDLEGGEVNALKGMALAMEQARCVIMEVNEPRLREQGLDPGTLVNAALELGRFNAVRLLPLAGGLPQAIEGLPRELAHYGWANVLLVKEGGLATP